MHVELQPLLVNKVRTAVLKDICRGAQGACPHGLAKREGCSMTA